MAIFVQLQITLDTDKQADERALFTPRRAPMSDSWSRPALAEELFAQPAQHLKIDTVGAAKIADQGVGRITWLAELVDH